MKKIVATFTTLMLGLGAAFAGPIVDKNPPIVDVCDCYPPGFQLSGFVSGLFPENGGDEAIGGGASLAYFFTEKVGLEASYHAYNSTPDVLHFSTLDLVYRLFTDTNPTCWSVYALAGGGIRSNGQNDGLYRAGLGIERRFESMNCLGVFLDGTYNWINDQDDAVIARLGFRIPF